MKGVLHNGFFLIIVELRGKNHAGMVINGRGKIRLHHGPVPANRKLRAILDVTLDQHHPVRFAETSGRTFPGIPVDVHVDRAESGLVHMPLQCRAFQNSGSGFSLHLKDQDDLFNGAARYLPPELYGFLKKFLIVVRHGIFTIPDTFRRLQAIEPIGMVGIDIPAQRAF